MGSFLKTLGRKFVAGFLILLPFLLAYLLIGGFVDLIVLLTQPLEDVLPHLGLMSPTARHVAILGLLFSIFVVVGIVKDTKPAQRLGAWVEREFLFKFPPYRLVRDITRQVEGEDIPSMQPALLELTPGIRTVGFIVEELDENLVTVFQPLTSLPTMGTLHIVSGAKVERLDAAFMDAIGWYFNWGADTHTVLSGRTADARAGHHRQVVPPP